MLELSEANLEESLAQIERPVLALLYADWCLFSRSFKHSFHEATKENNAVEFALTDISDEENMLWERYSIQTVPTLLLFHKGKLIQRVDGNPGEGLQNSSIEDMRRIVKSLPRP
ncbi:MAG: thioredoxin family protein [Candidatus Bathyarchaeia archaeon]